MAIGQLVGVDVTEYLDSNALAQTIPMLIERLGLSGFRLPRSSMCRSDVFISQLLPSYANTMTP